MPAAPDKPVTIYSNMIAQPASFSLASYVAVRLSAGSAWVKLRTEQMFSLLTLIPYLTYILIALLLIAAVAAIIYVPSPFKHYVIDACVIAAVAIQVYQLGFEEADTLAAAKLATVKAQYETTISNFNIESAKAVAAAAAQAKAENDANTALLKAQLDAQAAAAAQNEHDYQAVLAEINAAAADADKPAPGVILDAIGAKK